MTSNYHTAPWRVDSLVECPNVHIVGADGRTVAVVFQRDPHPKLGQGITVLQAREHACVMSAAPELLAFAQEFLSDYQGEDGMASMKHYARKAHEAIAKATGQSPA